MGRTSGAWGNVRKLSSGQYQARYVGPDRVRYQAPNTFSRIGPAKAWLAEQRTLIDQGKWKPPTAQAAETFGRYAAVWVQQRVTSKGEPIRPKTRTEYLRHLEVGLAEFGPMPLTGITPAVVRTWHAKRMQRGATQAAREAALLRAILQTAFDDELISRNPVEGKLTRAVTGIKHRPPTPEELAIIVDAMPDEWRLAVLLAAFGGLRLSEWRALRRQDLALADGRYSVKIERQAQRITGQGWVISPPKSAEGVRTVTLPSHLTEHVTHHLETHTGAFGGSLLFQPRGESEFIDDQRFAKPWNVARKRANVLEVVREHDLRAFAGTTYAQSGATLRETMAFLGHSSTAAAMAYQATTGRDAELAELMPALPKPKPSNVSQFPAASAES